MNLQELLDQLLLHFEPDGLVQEIKDIPYGKQLSLSDGENTVKLNLYSGKKGLNFQITGKDSPLREETETALNQLLGSAEEEQSLVPAQFDIPFAGSDECGKGDYFGPLVCAAVALKPEDCDLLKNLGVKDSKQLNDSRIKAIASMIRHQNITYKVLSLVPAKYNSMLQNFQSQGKNLNHLLAWMHTTVHKDLLLKAPDTRKILIDRFCGPELFYNLTQTSVELLIQPKAESNLAVAAASILAREKFLFWFEDHLREHKIPLPTGASDRVIRSARELVASVGASRLGEFAKLHFKTTKQVL